MNEAQKQAVEITGEFLANFARRVLRGETDCIEAETLTLLHLQREAGVVLLAGEKPSASPFPHDSELDIGYERAVNNLIFAGHFASIQPIVEETE